jgi:hypothetical protein
MNMVYGENAGERGMAVAMGDGLCVYFCVGGGAGKKRVDLKNQCFFELIAQGW